MRALKCSCCGGSDFRTESGYMVCNYCESKFIIDEPNTSTMRSKPSSKNDVEPNKTVAQQGIALRSDVEQLLLNLSVP